MAGGSNNAASIGNAVARVCVEVREKLAFAAVADVAGALYGRDATRLRMIDGALRAPDGRSEPLEKILTRITGGVVEVLGGNEPRNGRPGALAGLRTGQLDFSGGFADKDSVKFAFGAEFVEVRVHRRTREVRVSRLVGAFAAGIIINPITARSQLLGGMIWGISAALHEATEIDHRHARYTNDNLAEYLIPVNADIPSVEIIFVPEVDRARTLFDTLATMRAPACGFATNATSYDALKGEVATLRGRVSTDDASMLDSIDALARTVDGTARSHELASAKTDDANGICLAPGAIPLNAAAVDRAAEAVLMLERKREGM